MNELVREERRASKAGYHFVNLYQQCPRKWWMHYALGLVPTKVGKALIYGKAWHEACAAFLQGKTETEATAIGLQELDLSFKEYAYVEDSVVDRKKFEKVFPLWTLWAAQNVLDIYDIVEVEVEHTVELASGVHMTIRPDAVAKHKTNGSVVVLEHKTTSYSVDGMVKTVDAQDQATAYMMGVCKALPELAPHVVGVLLDVAYVRVTKGVISENVIIDAAIINRTRRDLAEFEISMTGLFNELGQKYLTWKAKPEKFPVPMLFPRNGSSCSLFGCEYENICRTTLSPGMAIGEDFEWDPLVGQDEDVLRKAASSYAPEA